jgi:hypothetical protein
MTQSSSTTQPQPQHPHQPRVRHVHPDLLARLDHLENQVLLDLPETKDPTESASPTLKSLRTQVISLSTLVTELKSTQEMLKDRQDLLENKALKVNQDLLDLLARLENVVTSAKHFWLHKTTLLTWMIVILALVVLDRLLLHFPQILAIVTKLL